MNPEIKVKKLLKDLQLLRDEAEFKAVEQGSVFNDSNAYHLWAGRADAYRSIRNLIKKEIEGY